MLTLNFSPFPALHTERLTLRRADATDIPQLYRLRSDEQIMKYIPRPVATSPDEIAEFLRLTDEKIASNKMINWKISIKGDPTLIGTIGFYYIKPEHYRAEIGYMLLPEFQGKGYVSEAIAAVVNYGFEAMGLHSIEALVDPENIASRAVLEKCGFVREAYFKENEFYNGKFLDTVVYSKLNA
ncbi:MULTISPECIES: GNAT family N-acetyltransferase [Sphingobacterium]|uniref:GNAT family N-acetyltransferase n=1 Tax=Sphingobacterium TaxID=28453 RepID=UPI0025FC43E4|nr:MULTISPECIES: GNAT family protein [unclassified Sphingobacterium]